MKRNEWLVLIVVSLAALLGLANALPAQDLTTRVNRLEAKLDAILARLNAAPATPPVVPAPEQPTAADLADYYDMQRHALAMGHPLIVFVATADPKTSVPCYTHRVWVKRFPGVFGEAVVVSVYKNGGLWNVATLPINSTAGAIQEAMNAGYRRVSGPPAYSTVVACAGGR